MTEPNPNPTPNSVDSVIASIMGGATEPKPVRFYRCPQCQHVFGHPAETLPPATCPSCAVKTVFRVHPTQAVAEEEARKARELIAKANPVPPAPAPAPLSVPATQPTAAQSPHEPAPAPEKPKAARKPATPKPAAQPAPAPTVTEPAAPSAPVTTDPRAARKAAIEKFVLENKLNCMAATPVGEGVVDSIGFTVWSERDGRRLPGFTFYEPTDTPASFKAELKEAQKTDGTVKLDVVRVRGLPAHLNELVFGGELVANIFDPRSGTVKTKVGDKVEIGARMSKGGTLVWVVTGVKK